MKPTSLVKIWDCKSDGAVMLAALASQKRRSMLRLTCDDFKKRR
jgi:hypothetical protein